MNDNGRQPPVTCCVGDARCMHNARFRPRPAQSKPLGFDAAASGDAVGLFQLLTSKEAPPLDAKDAVRQLPRH